MMKTLYLNLIALLFLVLGLLAPVDLLSEESPDNHDETVRELPVDKFRNTALRTTSVTEGSFQESIILPGEIAINGDSLIHIAPRFEGTLKKVNKHVGEEVKVGDVLAIVQSNQSLSTYEIKADGSGLVIDKDASVGEFVTNDKVIFTIANFDTVWVNAAVYSTELSRIKSGLAALVYSKSTNYSGRGTISYIRPTLNESTRTAQARIVLKNPEKKWFPGMFVRVSLEDSSKEQSLLIPSESALFIENEYVAFVQSKGSSGELFYRARDIKVGRDNGKVIQVLGGLEEGELVASGDTYLLKAELGKESSSHSH